MKTVDNFLTNLYPFLRRWWLLILLLLFLADVGLVYTFQTSRRVSAGDFFIPWYATREMVFHGSDPYSESITQSIQVAMTGQVFGPKIEDQLSFNYPLYTSLYLLPFIFFDYPLAEAIWNVINQFAMLGAVWACLRLSGLQSQSSATRLLPYLFAYLCYPFLYTIAYGQYTIVTLFFVVFGALLLQRERYWLGGALVALALFKPQTGLLLVAFVLFWCLLTWKKRLPALISGGAVGLGLLALPMLWYSDWPFRWLSQAGYRREHPGMYSYNEETVHLFGLSWSGAITLGYILSGLLGLGLLWLWVRDRNNPARFATLFSLTGLLTLLFLPQYGYCNDIVFYPAVFLLFKRCQEQLNSRSLIGLFIGGALVLYLPLLTLPALIKAGLVVMGIMWLGWEIRRIPLKPEIAPAVEPQALK